MSFELSLLVFLFTAKGPGPDEPHPPSLCIRHTPLGRAWVYPLCLTCASLGTGSTPSCTYTSGHADECLLLSPQTKLFCAHSLAAAGSDLEFSKTRALPTFTGGKAIPPWVFGTGCHACVINPEIESSRSSMLPPWYFGGARTPRSLELATPSCIFGCSKL